jgi:hypothetical protein
MKNTNRAGYTIAELIAVIGALLGILLFITFIVTVAWVIGHFIHKMW